MADNGVYKGILFLLLFSALACALYVVVSQTDIVFKTPGTTWSERIRVHEFAGNLTGEGYIVLKRNVDTPSAMDFASFDGKPLVYYTISEGERVVKELSISIPVGLPKGTYAIDYEVVLGENTWYETLRFRVRETPETT